MKLKVGDLYRITHSLPCYGYGDFETKNKVCLFVGEEYSNHGSTKNPWIEHFYLIEDRLIIIQFDKLSPYGLTIDSYFEKINK